MVRRVRKPALGATHTAFMIVKPTGNPVPLVVPIARVRHGLELELWFAQRRERFVNQDGPFRFGALVQEVNCLVERLLCLGRVRILFEDDLKVYVRAKPIASASLLGVVIRVNVPSIAA